MPGPDPELVKAQLAAAVLALVETLLPDGKLEGREWRGHGADGAKWGVVVKGGKLGTWQNFGAGTGGRSLLSLVRDAACGGDHLAAYRWACDWLGGAKVERPAMPTPHQATERSSGTGMRLYLAGVPCASWDSPIGSYLIGRGIAPECFPGPLRGLRFLVRCMHAETDQHLPAMLAPVIDPQSRDHLATHRTYLSRDGARWRKAPVTPAKKSLGRFAGGLIPLTKGQSGKGWGHLPQGEALILAEGIENALSVACYLPELRAAAYVSAGNLANLVLPVAIGRIVLVIDRDGDNAAILEGRQAAIYHWQREGRAVDLWQPPAGCKDANDFLQRERLAA
jgi:hypothetical protein